MWYAMYLNSLHLHGGSKEPKFLVVKTQFLSLVLLVTEEEEDEEEVDEELEATFPFLLDDIEDRCFALEGVLLLFTTTVSEENVTV